MTEPDEGHWPGPVVTPPSAASFLAASAFLSSAPPPPQPSSSVPAPFYSGEQSGHKGGEWRTRQDLKQVGPDGRGHGCNYGWDSSPAI